jgi:hypothetical protein
MMLFDRPYPHSLSAFSLRDWGEKGDLNDTKTEFVCGQLQYRFIQNQFEADYLKMRYHRIKLLVTICSYFKGWIVGRNGLVISWTVYLCWRHQAGSGLGSYTTQVQSQG